MSVKNFLLSLPRRCDLSQVMFDEGMQQKCRQSDTSHYWTRYILSKNKHLNSMNYEGKIIIYTDGWVGVFCKFVQK